MLRDIVTIIESNNHRIEDGTLFISDIQVNMGVQECVSFLEEKNIIENTDYDVQHDTVIALELTTSRLNAIGYYVDEDEFVLKNKYSIAQNDYYIASIKKFNDEDHLFVKQVKSVLSLINTIRENAKHTFTNVDIEFALIFRDDKSLVIPLHYTAKDIKCLSMEGLTSISQMIDTLEELNSEKKLLFLNELIEFLLPTAEYDRFSILLKSIQQYLDNAVNAYQYYLRDFSYNKLKVELDAKVLEFTQKLQSVINDSQAKLVTIPTAFVLVFSVFDFSSLTNIKNIVGILSLFIFAIIIQVFLNNQYSSLNFTKESIDSYKQTFSQNNIQKLSERFVIVDRELTKQRKRLNLVTFILWLIPGSLVILWGILVFRYYALMSIILILINVL